jgi:prepilin-type N-terminal cleavage/methylation domain-containing protein
MPKTYLRQKAFTLIELLIVIAIILILVAIALPNFLEAQIRAKVARASGDMRTISIAMETYFLDFKIYPTDTSPTAETISAGFFN